MNTDPLFTSAPLFGGQTKNRFVLAPLTRGRAGISRVPTGVMADYYTQRASAGLIITEATTISEEGIGWIDSAGIFNEDQRDGWQQITRQVKQQGSKIVLQLWHCGRASHSDFHNGVAPLSASAVKLEGDHIHTPNGQKAFEVPRAMSVDDIQRTINDYKDAAQRAKEAGFDGVEVHAANGYLINQFLDGRSNQRDDEYGGTLENRARFLMQVLNAVLTVWSPSQVGLRISPNGVFNDMGCDDYRELYHYVAMQANTLKLGYLHVMDGLAFGFHERGEPMTLADFRPLFDGILIGNCGYNAESAAAAIAQGNADLIAFGRPYISNPDLPQRIQHNWPLAPFDDMTHWYGGGAEGYSDYPAYQAEDV